jgi:hypothetical protein
LQKREENIKACESLGSVQIYILSTLSTLIYEDSFVLAA